MSKIELADLEAIAGISASKWTRNGRVRYYLNIPGAAYTVYWTEDGKVHFGLAKGRSTDAANAIAKAILGCSTVDRRRSPHGYIVIED